MTRRILIAGNWKMNGLGADGRALAGAIAERAAAEPPPACDILLCPPATLLREVAALVGDRVAVGGQDCHSQAAGAHTGDVSAPMLVDAGAGWTLVGHSERRADHGEDDSMVRARALAARRAGLRVVICVGETESGRDAGDATATVVGQLAGSVPWEAAPVDTVIAYEPVWAIGTGRTATPDEVAEMHAAIRGWLQARSGDGADWRILYGGSVKPDNAATLLALDDIDGALVGGSSLKAEDFIAIIDACPTDAG